jgi:hypothetical protein
MEEEKIPPINGALVFYHPKVEIAIPEEATPPAATLQIGNLKEFLRKSARSKSLPSVISDEINHLISSD